MSLRAAFLIVVASAVFHVSYWVTLIILAEYYGSEQVDKWLAQRRRNEIIEYHTHGWEKDLEDPSLENKGNMSRKRLVGDGQIIVSRRNYCGGCHRQPNAQ